MVYRAAALSLAVLAAHSTAFAARSTAPWFACTTHQLGAAQRFCRDARTLKNAWYVYKPYGSFHLIDGRYARPGSMLRIEILDQAGLIAIENERAVVLAKLHLKGASSLYASLMVRTAGGFFSNAATVFIGRGMRPRTVTLRGDRLRISVVQQNGRETTQIYHVTGHSLIAAATRHAQ